MMLAARFLAILSMGVVARAYSCGNYGVEGMCSYAGQGYDIVLGDPHSDNADPGWRNEIFDDGWKRSEVQVDPVNMCSYVASTAEMNGGKSAQTAMQEAWTYGASAEASVDFWGFKASTHFEFSGSQSVEHVEHATSEYSSHFFESKASCQLYRIELPPRTARYNFTKYFSGAVASLPTSAALPSDRLTIFNELIKNYGTHFAHIHYRGGQMVLRSEMTSSAYDSYTQWCRTNSESYTAGAEGSYMNFAMSVDGSFSKDTESKATTQFNEAMKTGTRSTLYRGGAMVHGDTEAWYKSLKGTMTVLPASEGGALVRVSELLTAMNFPDDPHIDLKRAAVETTYEGLCSMYTECRNSPYDPMTDFKSSIALAYPSLAVGWHPEQTQVAMGDQRANVVVFNVTTGWPVLDLKGHLFWVSSIEWSPDASKIVTAAGDGMIKVWDAKTGNQLLSWKGDSDWVWRAKFAYDGLNIVSMGPGDKQIKIWDAATGNLTRTIRDAADDLRFRGSRLLALTADDSLIATGSESSGGNNSIRVFNFGSGKKLVEFVHDGANSIYSLEFSPDGKYLASATSGSGTSNCNVKIWFATTGYLIKTINLPLLGSHDSGDGISWSPDGSHLAVAGKSIYVVNVHTGKLETTQNVTMASNIEAIKHSPDGKLLLSGGAAAKKEKGAAGVLLVSLASESLPLALTKTILV